MWTTKDEASFGTLSDVNGDDYQKLSVIHSLPSLLEGDSQGCLSRIIPKMQETLPTASIEFHLAASSTFKNILQQNLVSYSIFIRTFLQSILDSLESRDTTISRAWVDTLLDVIELLPVEIIREEILPRAIVKGQLMQPVASRVICCKLVGKVCTRFDSVLIKKEVLPTVHSLCQDVSSEVRACICLQLHYVAENLDSESIMSALLPSLVELASDEESSVRYASVQSIVDLMSHLQEESKKNTIVPLVKKLFESALKSNDNVIIIISQVFGKFVLEIQKCLRSMEYSWFVQYFQQVAQLGICTGNKEPVQDNLLPFEDTNPWSTEKYVECRRNCASNIPAMFMFMSVVGDVNVLLPTLSDLARDPYVIVRKSVARSIHEVANVLGSRSGLLKTDFCTLLKNDSNEVVYGLVPHLSEVLLHLARSNIIGIEQVDSSVIELGKLLLKCESQISKTNNWRLGEAIMTQFQILPKCFPSDYIYVKFLPVIMGRVLNARPLPVRLAAGKTLLVFLRYNLQSLQRTELRNKIVTELAHNSNCYTRMLFVRIMNEALSMFSSVYFKEHFFSTLLSMINDTVANIRLKVVTMLPTLKQIFKLPMDKKLLAALETNVRKLLNNEKDKDVIWALKLSIQNMDKIELKHEGEVIMSKISNYETEDLMKYEEEQKLETMIIGKSIDSYLAAGSSTKKVFKSTKTGGSKKANFREVSSLKTVNNETESTSKFMAHPSTKGKQAAPLGLNETLQSSGIKTSFPLTKESFDSAKTSTSSNNLTSNWARLASNSMLLKHPWERMGRPSYSDKHENEFNYPHAKFNPCNCYKMSYISQPQLLPSNSSDQEPKGFSCRSCSDYSECLRSRNSQYKHDSNSTSEFDTSLLLTHLDKDKHELLKNLLLTHQDINGDGKTPEFMALQALTNAAHYNSCWAFSSMPEWPVTFLDDEFIIDAGISIPSQLSTSQSTSKIPNLQDIIYRKKSMNVDKSRRYSSNGVTNFQKVKINNEDYKEPTREMSSIYSAGNLDCKDETRRSYNGIKDNSSIVSRSDNSKPTQSRNLSDRTKRHSATYPLKLPEYKNTKSNFKRHSMEVIDHTPVERRAFRRYSAFDVNHNEGPSKIPLRSFQLGSRTTPATRVSSPVRAEAGLCFQRSITQQTSAQSLPQDRRLIKFSSSNEELDKLCQKLLYRQKAPSSNRTPSPKSKESKLPIRLQRNKL